MLGVVTLAVGVLGLLALSNRKPSAPKTEREAIRQLDKRATDAESRAQKARKAVKHFADKADALTPPATPQKPRMVEVVNVKPSKSKEPRVVRDIPAPRKRARFPTIDPDALSRGADDSRAAQDFDFSKLRNIETKKPAPKPRQKMLPRSGVVIDVPYGGRREPAQAAQDLSDHARALINAGKGSQLGTKNAPSETVAQAQDDMGGNTGTRGIYGPLVRARIKALTGKTAPIRR